MVYVYLIIGLILLAGLFNGRSSPPQTGTADGFFYYKGIPVRKCREVTTDDDGNFRIDGELLTVRDLDAWHRTLTHSPHSTKDF